MRLILIVGMLATSGLGFILWRAAVRIAVPPAPSHSETSPSPAQQQVAAIEEKASVGSPPPVVAQANSSRSEVPGAAKATTPPARGEVRWASSGESRRSERLIQLDDVRKIFLADPTDESRLTRAVSLATELEAWPELVDILSRAVDATPENLDRRFDLAAVQMRLNLWSLAVDQLCFVVAGRPEDRRAAYNLAIAMTAAARLHEARDAWDRVIGLGADADSLARRAEVQMDLENWDDAAVNLTAAHELEPDSVEISLNLATALERSSRCVEAEAILAGLIEKQPQNVPAMMRLAQLIWRNYELKLPSAENVVDRGATAALLCGRILAVQPSHAEARALRDRIDDALAHWCPPRDMTEADRERIARRIAERLAELEKERRSDDR